MVFHLIPTVFSHLGVFFVKVLKFPVPLLLPLSEPWECLPYNDDVRLVRMLLEDFIKLTFACLLKIICKNGVIEVQNLA